MIRNRKLLIGLLLAAVVTACTTQKRRGEMSMLGKLYHNTTAHYNGYFNAEELRKASVLALEEQHDDNYTKILPLYPVAEAENPQGVAPDLDQAIEKVSIVVNLHRVSNWTDDCYLLVGQARYLKQDYEAAEKTFRYLINEFSPEKMAEAEGVSKSDKKVDKRKPKKAKKRKKMQRKKSKVSKEKARALKRYNKAVRKARKRGGKAPEKPAILQADSGRESPQPSPEEESGKKTEAEEKAETPEEGPDNYFLKHRPAYQEGVLWLARTLIERDNYDQAMRYIRQLDQDPGTFEDVRSELMAVEAYYYLTQKEYEAALLPLRRAIDQGQDRSKKARYAFIRAQILQGLGRWVEAYDAFDEVLKYGPEYEMEFTTRLNMAQNAWLSGKGTAEDAQAKLERMQKDGKNVEYQDQIYFALANIALKQGDRQEAIRNLELSLKYSRSNRSQKAESYLTLADLYFEEEVFIKAKLYYDSTLQVLASTDDRYNRVERLTNNLREIAENLQIIELQDSLLRIAQMSGEEKLELASRIKRERDRKKLAALKESQAGATDRGAPSARFNAPNLGRTTATGFGGQTGGGTAESAFFAYDDRAVRRGLRDFERQWGDRSLEDNWRRSNRRDAGEFREEEEILEEGGVIALTDEEVAKLLGDVPASEQEIAAAHLMMQEAMYKLGSLYRTRLENHERAVDILEELNERFPGNTFELDSWYLLYLAFTDLNRPDKAREYADKIIGKYPTSTYAKVIQDPSYAETLMDEERRLNRYYDEAYSAFTTGNYQEAYQKSTAAKEKFGAANPFRAKFALLSAMCTGNLQGKEAYVSALTEVVARYPDTPEQTRAKEILRLLGGVSAALPGDEKEAAAQYVVEDDQLHYVIIAFEKGTSLNEQKIAISNYNLKYHKLDKLRISNIFLGTDPNNSMPLVVIRRFKDKAEAMTYYEGVQKNQGDFIDPSELSYEMFAISQNNYRQILREKSLEGYRAFFELNYR